PATESSRFWTASTTAPSLPLAGLARKTFLSICSPSLQVRKIYVWRAAPRPVAFSMTSPAPFITQRGKRDRSAPPLGRYGFNRYRLVAKARDRHHHRLRTGTGAWRDTRRRRRRRPARHATRGHSLGPERAGQWRSCGRCPSRDRPGARMVAIPKSDARHIGGDEGHTTQRRQTSNRLSKDRRRARRRHARLRIDARRVAPVARRLNLTRSARDRA